jgi:hypothetical protein
MKLTLEDIETSSLVSFASKIIFIGFKLKFKYDTRSNVTSITLTKNNF